MGQRADGKYGGPDGVNEVNYGPKTSQYGHYELSDFGHAGMNTDGTKWKSQNMVWIEDNRKFEAPPATKQVPASQPEGPPPEVQLSNRAASANAETQAYEDVLLNRQGHAAINGAFSSVQDFKNAYQNNLTEELRTTAPTTFANKKAEIELADKQKAEIEDSFALNLGQY